MSMLKNVINFTTFGAIDKHEAKKIVKNSKQRQSQIKHELEINREKTEKTLNKLGNLKEQIYNGVLQDFVSISAPLQKISLKPLKKAVAVTNISQYKEDLVEVTKISTNFKALAIGGTGSVALGIAAAGGTYALVGMLGTASTGTAIATLSGAAAHTATLAWLGGGALSAGGAGMAGGVLVLGGITLVPLAIFVMFMGYKKGKQQLNEAHNFEEQVDVLVEKIITLIAELYKIQEGAKIVQDTILGLEQVLKIKNEEARKIVDRIENRSLLNKIIIDPTKKIFGIDIYTDEETSVIKDATNTAVLLKKIMDMPLLGEDGSFLSQVTEYIIEQQSLINDIQL